MEVEEKKYDKTLELIFLGSHFLPWSADKVFLMPHPLFIPSQVGERYRK